MPDDLRLGILGNVEISRKSMEGLELKASVELDTQSENLTVLKYFTEKLILLNFERLFTVFRKILLIFATNIMI